jgi:ArsR family transcriptional regulator, zinc-responsive transcriptional repressor
MNKAISLERMEMAKKSASSAVRAKAQSRKLMSLDRLQQAAECLKAIAHPHRLRMIQMLLAGSYTVGELAEACEIPSHMASEHLKLLQRCGFLASRRDGRSVYYSVIEKHLKQLMACIESRF